MAPRIKIHKDGRATLAGLNYADLRSILTSAWLDSHASLQKHKAEKKPDRETVEWCETQLKLLDLAKESMDLAIAGTFPPRPPSTKAERWARVREEQKTRRIIDEIINNVRVKKRHVKAKREMTKVTLRCKTCGYSARRDLLQEPGSRGVHETSSEPASCPRGHGGLVREDGLQQQTPGSLGEEEEVDGRKSRG